jgi:hypothetical protein
MDSDCQLAFRNPSIAWSNDQVLDHLQELFPELKFPKRNSRGMIELALKFPLVFRDRHQLNKDKYFIKVTKGHTTWDPGPCLNLVLQEWQGHQAYLWRRPQDVPAVADAKEHDAPPSRPAVGPLLCNLSSLFRARPGNTRRAERRPAPPPTSLPVIPRQSTTMDTTRARGGRTWVMTNGAPELVKALYIYIYLFWCGYASSGSGKRVTARLPNRHEAVPQSLVTGCGMHTLVDLALPS